MTDLLSRATMPSPSTAKARDPYWDNARFILIATVVIGHFIEPFRDEGTAPFLIYTFLYMFHMPAMLFISGYFSRAETTTKSIVGVIQLLGTYLIWECIMAGVRFLATGDLPSEGFLVRPSFALWFLLALAIMKIALPYIMRFRFPLTLTLAVAVFSGFLPMVGTEFSMARTLNFLPFFVFGFIVKERGWFTAAWFKTPNAALHIGAFAWLAGILGLLAARAKFFGIDWSDLSWLYWKEDYADVEVLPVANDMLGIDLGSDNEIFSLPNLVDAVSHLVLMPVIMLTILAFLLLIPRRQMFFSAFGSRTMYVYLFHVPVAWLLSKSEWVGNLYEAHGIQTVLALIILALAVTLVASTSVVKKIGRPFIEPKFTSLLKK